MRLFLDSSVLLAASGSDRGASREVVRRAAVCRWVLMTTPYVVAEVHANLPDFPVSATVEWARLRPDLALMEDVLTIDRAAVFQPAKDRPILFSALAWSQVLLTLDRADLAGNDGAGDAGYGECRRRTVTVTNYRAGSGRGYRRRPEPVGEIGPSGDIVDEVGRWVKK